MTDVAAQTGAALGAAVTGGIKKAETAVGSVIGRIASGALTVWKDIQAEIEADVAKVKGALPASATTGLAQVETDVKQSASDTLSMVLNGALVLEPEAVAAIEAVLDGALAKSTDGLALPLVPIVNNGISALGTTVVGVVQAWVLKRQAASAAAKPS